MTIGAMDVPASSVLTSSMMASVEFDMTGSPLERWV
jgi:hypothetical protein